MKAPCYQCGKPAVIDGLCASCFNLAHPLIDIGTPLSLTVCKRCGAVKVPKGWKPVTDKDANCDDVLLHQLNTLLDQELKIKGEAIEIEVEKKKELDRVVHIEVHAHGKSHSSLPPHQYSVDVEVRISNATCETCSMMSGGYHEMILQIRAEDRMITEEEDQEILSIITERTVAEYGSDKKAFVTSIDRTKFGLDILIGSEHLGNRIADELESTFLASRKENYKLIGQERGDKKKYRLTVVLRLPKFSIGDFVEVTDKPCQILSMGRGGLKCYDLVERYEFTVTPKSAKWRTIRYLAPKSDIRPKMVVSIDFDGTVQLMDSESYELYEANQSVLGDDVQQGNTIDVLHIEGKLYAVPKVTSSSD